VGIRHADRATPSTRKGWHYRCSSFVDYGHGVHPILCDPYFSDSVVVKALFFLILVCEAIGTAATSGLLCQPRVIVKMHYAASRKVAGSSPDEVDFFRLT
jgi:hypothetical protein